MRISLFLGVLTALGFSFLPIDAQDPNPRAKTVLVIHGGAGALDDAEMKAEGLTRREFEEALVQALQTGYRTLSKRGTSVDAVEAAIRVMEDSHLFNAGHGAVFNSDGRVEMDASIMEGNMEGVGEGKRDPRKRAGAVAGVSHVKNPISAARAVMEMPDGRHMMLFGSGAEDFVFTEENRARYKIERVSNIYFWTDRQLKSIREEYRKSAAPAQRKAAALPDLASRRFGTVGAVALDRGNHIAAGTSTGGLTNKLPGRIGDSPIIGAGTYADDRACGVSCTGTGEVFIRHAVAHEIAARMIPGKAKIGDAVKDTIDSLPDQEDGVGGLIALDRNGVHAFGLSKKTAGMYRGYVTEHGDIHVGIFADESPKLMKKGTDRN